MNRFHQRYCASEKWRSLMVEETLPWVLDGLELTGPVLEVGPGPGLVTEALVRYGVEQLTTLEIDEVAAADLADRYRGRVQVEVGDAAAMPFQDEQFDTVICCTMLHHVPTVDAQDRVLSEANRVLRPGGVLAGSDSRTDLRFRVFHLFDIHNPIDPYTMEVRLRHVGFTDVEVEPVPGRFRFQAVTA